MTRLDAENVLMVIRLLDESDQITFLANAMELAFLKGQMKGRDEAYRSVTSTLINNCLVETVRPS